MKLDSNIYHGYRLAYADDVSMLGGSIHTVKENAEALVVATKDKQEPACMLLFIAGESA